MVVSKPLLSIIEVNSIFMKNSYANIFHYSLYILFKCRRKNYTYPYIEYSAKTVDNKHMAYDITLA